MGLDEFLGHSSTERRGGGARVLNWKKRNPAQIETWLHAQASIVALWRHGWPRVVERERDGEKVVEVWGGNFNCWESEEVLRKQHRRDDSGARIAPPRVCPICLMVEHVRGLVSAGKMEWTQPLFAFKGDDSDKDTILTAAGLYNGFNGDLSRQEIADLRKAGVRRDEAWKQNTMAKCSYLFAIVDNSEVEKGVQVCIETTALGDAVKRVIRDQIDSLGEREGHPLRNPYAIRWEYRPQEQEFSKKYRALAMPRLELTPEIRDLINGPLPDLGEHIGRGNVAALRASMESHALVQLPWDRFFAAAEAEEGVSTPKATSPAPKAESAPEGPSSASNEASPVRRRGAAAKTGPVEPSWPEGTKLLPCDACGANMAETDSTCWKCSAKYEVDEPAPAKAAPAKSGKAAGWVEEDDGVGF